MSLRFIAALDLPDVMPDWPGGATAYLEQALPEVMRHMVISVVPVEDDYEVISKPELAALVRMAVREIRPDVWSDGTYDADEAIVRHWARGLLDPDPAEQIHPAGSCNEELPCDECVGQTVLPSELRSDEGS